MSEALGEAPCQADCSQLAQLRGREERACDLEVSQERAYSPQLDRTGF